MANSSETISIWVKVRGNAEKSLRGVNSQLSKTGKAAKKGAISFKALSAAAVGLVVLKKAHDWMKESARLAMVQQAAEAKLAAALGGTSQALLDYASDLQLATTYGDEETIASMALVANFVKEEEQIKRITKAAQDLATAKKMSLANATDIVTKSVSSSTNAMARYGIEIDGAAGSVERIDSAVEALDKAFGGMAEAAALTDSGKIQQMENAIGDLREEIGEEYLPVMVKSKEAQLAFMEAIADPDGLVIKLATNMAKLAKQTADVFAWYAGGEKAFNDTADATWRYDETIEKLTKKLKRFEGAFIRNGVIIRQTTAEIARVQKLKVDYDAKVAQKKADREKADRGAELAANKKQGEDKTKTATEGDKKLAAKRKKLKEEMAEWDTDWRAASIDNNAEYYEILWQQEQDANAKKLELENVEKERKASNLQASIDIAQQTANAVQNIMSSVNNRKQQEYDNELQRQKAEVAASTKSARQKALEIEKIDKQAAKDRYAARVKEWRQAIAMSIINTGIGATMQLTGGDVYSAIPRAIAVGILGNIETAMVLANKPRMYNGGELTNKTGMLGDVVPFVGRVGERVVTPEEHARGGQQQITIGAPQVIIQGNADGGTVEAIKSVLRDHTAATIEALFSSGQINPTIVNNALGV